MIRFWARKCSHVEGEAVVLPYVSRFCGDVKDSPHHENSAGVIEHLPLKLPQGVVVLVEFHIWCSTHDVFRVSVR
jgi:hypothetical protein